MSIDYGMGKSNIDFETGIRYGVISLNNVASHFYDDQEFDYGEAICPECGSALIESSSTQASNFATKDYFCMTCFENYLPEHDNEEDAAKVASHFSDVCFPEEPLSWSITDSEYSIVPCLDNDAFILKSPYFTYADHCSPCVPGAGDLDNPTTWDQVNKGFGVKAYCLGPDFFDEYNVIPYTVYSVATGEVVKAKAE